ncbi:MAG: hypothetical protein ACPL88_03095, partial [Bryobacteraceae bacterium]
MRVWWYSLLWQGRRIQRSTGTANKGLAQQIEAAEKARLARGEAGIVERRGPKPTLEQLAPKFLEAISSGSPRGGTNRFYEEKLRRLLEHRELARLPLDRIEEAVIDGYKQQRLKEVTRLGGRCGQPASTASWPRCTG